LHNHGCGHQGVGGSRIIIKEEMRCGAVRPNKVKVHVQLGDVVGQRAGSMEEAICCMSNLEPVGSLQWTCIPKCMAVLRSVIRCPWCPPRYSKGPSATATQIRDQWECCKSPKGVRMKGGAGESG